MLVNNLQDTERDSHPICCSLLAVGRGPWKPSHRECPKLVRNLPPTSCSNTKVLNVWQRLLGFSDKKRGALGSNM